tara:strand:+ start:507 stop:1277 length:771 start_codon:yes stop_codon:yes gene_type:complete
MIDIHNHILPNVDDGSKSIEESLKMLETAIDQGITDVVSTVHFQHPKIENRDLGYEILIEKIDLLQSTIGEKIKIHLGAEVFFLPNLLDVKKYNFTVFNHGKYMLIEFQSYYNHPQYKEVLSDLLLSGTIPVIAHPERSMLFRKNFNELIELIEMGCLLQLNAGSILGHFGKMAKKTAKELLERDMIHFLASDAHNIKKRNFCLLPALEKIEQIVGERSRLLVIDNPKDLIKGNPIIPSKVKNKKVSWSFFKDFFL